MTRPLYLWGRSLDKRCIVGWVGPSGDLDLWDKKKNPLPYRVQKHERPVHILVTVPKLSQFPKYL